MSGGFREVINPAPVLPLPRRLRRRRGALSHQLGRTQGGADRRSRRRRADGRLRRRDRSGFGLEVLTSMPAAPSPAAPAAIRRLARMLMVALLAFPASSCVAVSSYLAGMDDNPENYTWEPIPGTTHKATWAQDIKECEAPGTPVQGAKARATTDVPTIQRSENAPVVAACMADKGYRKLYQTRNDLF
jgi:hypothetical protein